MASGKVGDCGRIRKEKSENGRIWGEGKRVRKRMNGVGGGADWGLIRKEKSENRRLWGEGKRVRKRMNGVGGEQTADGSARKRAKMGGYGVKRKG